VKSFKLSPIFYILLGIVFGLTIRYGKNLNVNQITAPTPSPTVDITNTKSLLIGGVKVAVEVVNTPEEMARGLSGRENLEQGTGMLFVYKKPQHATFWMPNMNFPIDIIFIRDNTVVSLYENIPNHPKDTPLEDLPRYPSNEPVDMVLEVPAGWASKNYIVTGTKITFTE